jgi:hypothetical protein
VIFVLSLIRRPLSVGWEVVDRGRLRDPGRRISRMRPKAGAGQPRRPKFSQLVYVRKAYFQGTARDDRPHMMPDNPQQRRMFIFQLALIAAIITVMVIVAASQY